MSSEAGSERLRASILHDLVGHVPGHNVHRNREVPTIDRAVPEVMIAAAVAYEAAARFIPFGTDGLAEPFKQPLRAARGCVRARSIRSGLRGRLERQSRSP